jgi:ferredoxin-NADP reductase
MVEKWKKFREEMKLKRAWKKAQKDSRDEIVIQRLSSSVSGKAQKYTRIGPREFVDFADRELTIENKGCLYEAFRAKDWWRYGL